MFLVLAVTLQKTAEDDKRLKMISGWRLIINKAFIHVFIYRFKLSIFVIYISGSLFPQETVSITKEIPTKSVEDHTL